MTTDLLDGPGFGRPMRPSGLPEGVDGDDWQGLPDIACGAAVARLVDPLVAVRWPGFARTFARFASGSDAGPPVSLVERDRAGRVLGQLREATALLAAVLPELGPEVWSHADGVTVIDSAGRFLSLTIPIGPPGLLAIDCSVLDTPARAAELLFHEALHAKLRRIDTAGALLHADVDDVLVIGWRDEKWTAARVLAAAHVYVHLVALGEAMVERDVDAEHGHRLLATAVPRARFLLGALPAGTALTERGRAFVRWLTDADVDRMADVAGSA